MPASLLRRACATAAVATALTLGTVTTASAHVRVFPDSTTPGSFSGLTFRVPNESDTAGTVKVQVQLPQDTPFLYVSSKPVPGWTAVSAEETLPKPQTYEGTTITKAVRTVTWTADRGTEIAPGQYQEFSLSVGPLPGAGTVLLPATQTYSDGAVVRWDEPTPASGAEPEHPAPTLVIAAPTVPATPSSSSEVLSDPVARGLGAAGLVVAVAGLVTALVRRRT